MTELLFCFFCKRVRPVLFVCVRWLVCRPLLLSPGWSFIAGGCGCRGSTTLIQHAQCSFCSFYSCEHNWLTPPNNVFKAVFFTVWCLFSVPVACAAVNRHLGSCFFFFFLVCFFNSMWLELSRLHQNRSVSACVHVHARPVHRCPFLPFLSWAKCRVDDVQVKKNKWGRRWDVCTVGPRWMVTVCRCTRRRRPRVCARACVCLRTQTARACKLMI